MRTRYLAASLVVCWLALWLRLTTLGALPVFVDEGTHLAWAQFFAAGQPDYPWLMHGKLLVGVALAQFHVMGPGALWLSRAAVALMSLPTCAACIAAGTLAASRRVGLLAGLIYAVWPYAVFHERQVLADPLAATCGSLALVCWLRFARTGRFKWWWPAPAWLAAAVLSKLTGTVYLAPLGIAALLLAPTWPGRWRLWLWSALAVAAAAVLGGLVLMGLRPWLGSGATDLASQQVGFIACPPLVCQGDLAQQLRVSQQAIAGWLEAALIYLGWPGLLLAIAAPVLADRFGLPRWARAVNWLWWSTAALVVLMIGSAKAALPPRYFAPAAMPAAVLAALGWASCAQALRRHSRLVWRDPASWLINVWLAGSVLWPMAQLPALIISPRQADLPDLDREQYIDGPYAGTGLHEAAAAILRHEAGGASPARVLVNHYLLTTFSAYFDRTQIDPVAPLDATWPEVAGTLAAGGQVYLVDQIAASDPEWGQPAGELLGVYPRLGGEYLARVQVFDDSQPAALSGLYAILFGQLDNFRSDYAALAQYLGEQAPPFPVVTYPSSQGPYLQSLLDPASKAVVITTGSAGSPWSIPATLAELEHVVSQHDRLAVSFFLETRLDPAREVEAWLAQRLFRVNERWFGPVRLVEYAGSGATFDVLPVEARFGDVIRLEAVDVFDAAVSSGGRMRLRLHWLAEDRVDRNYKVFVHLFDQTGIAAQHDGQPVAELRPTTTWQPGEAIVDQFAIAVPEAIPPGVYQLRIGLYDVGSLARLPVRLADGSQAEFFVGGEITIR